MRLDKYLKISRLIKRRTVAKDSCDKGHVLVCGKPAKAGYEVKVGDIIEIHFGLRVTRVEILDLPKAATKEGAPLLYKEL